MNNNALNVFEAQLRTETLQSERLRALLMAIVTAGLGTVFFIAQSLGGSEFLEMMRTTGVAWRKG